MGLIIASRRGGRVLGAGMSRRLGAGVARCWGRGSAVQLPPGPFLLESGRQSIAAMIASARFSGMQRRPILELADELERLLNDTLLRIEEERKVFARRESA